MSTEPADVLDRLEREIARLSDPSAPLDELVNAHQRAVELLDQAEAELRALRARVEELSRQLASP